MTAVAAGMLGTVLSNGICKKMPASSLHPLPATPGLVPRAVKNHMQSPANRVEHPSVLDHRHQC